MRWLFGLISRRLKLLNIDPNAVGLYSSWAHHVEHVDVVGGIDKRQSRRGIHSEQWLRERLGLQNVWHWSHDLLQLEAAHARWHAQT